jgi:ATP-dependent helicase/nuclease subunit A
VDVGGIRADYPPDSDPAQLEASYLAKERRRTAYVAATRARDLLIIPVTAPKGINADLAAMSAGMPAPREDAQDAERSGPAGRELLAEWVEGAQPPEWASGLEPVPQAEPPRAHPEEDGASQRWRSALADAQRPRLVPISVTRAAHTPKGPPGARGQRGALAAQEGDAGAGGDDGGGPRRPGRFGPAFGSAVHRALRLCLEPPGVAARAAVELAASEVGLAAHLDEAEADVARTLGTLAALGIPASGQLRLEYPVAGARGDEELLSGFCDLVHVDETQVTVLDFKTDGPPVGAVDAACPDYVAQVRLYAKLLVEAGVAKPGRIRAGLLFTAREGVAWVDGAVP